MQLGEDNVLIMFISYLARQGIPCCIVGNTDGFPSVIEGDVDIIIPQDRIVTIHSTVVSFCKDNGFRIVQCLQHENNAFYYVIQWFENDGPKFLKLDICGDYYRKARLFLTASALLTQIIAAKDDQGNRKHFFVPAPATEFIYYLLKKLDKGGISNRHSLHLHNQWKQDPEGCKNNIQHFWKKSECDLIMKAALTNNWVPVIEAIPLLKKSIHRNVHFTWKGIWGELYRRIKRVMYPTGLTVAFLGPDGSGKSSVLQAVADSLAPAFRKQASYHLRPFLLPARAAGDGGVVTNPHAFKEYNVVISLIKLIYLWADYLIGHFTIIRWKKIFSTFVLFDRYFQDMLVDPKRFRYGGPSWFPMTLEKILPEPDVLIFLNTPAETIQTRKNEVSYDECVRQNNEYICVASKMENAIVIDASKPLNDVVSEINKQLLNILAQRTGKKLRRLSTKQW